MRTSASTPHSATHHAARAAERGEHEPFAQELADDPAAARAERGADGDFAPAGGAAREQQVRDVGARDQQHRRDRREQHDEPEPVVADEHVLEPAHDARRACRCADSPARCARRWRSARLAPPARSTPGCRRPSAFRNDAPRCVGPLRRKPRRHDRHPDVGRVLGVEGELEAGRHHADDRDRIAVERDRAADDRRVARKLPASTGRSEITAVRAAPRASSLGAEHAPLDRRDAEQREEIGRDDGERDRDRRRRAPVSVAAAVAYAAMRSIVVACARQSRKSR